MINITNDHKISRKRPFLLIFPIGILVLMLINMDLVIDGAASGLAVCLQTIIPSLFPFMVMSEMITTSGVAELVGLAFGRPFEKLFKISGSGVCPAILGALCGFPIGAKSAISLYEQGQLSRDETERLVAFSNLSGPAFVVGGVGITLWKSPAFGVVLYISQILSAILVGFLLALTLPKITKKTTEKKVSMHRFSPPPLPHMISEGVSNAATAILPICGFVVFFSVLSRVVITLISAITDNSIISGFVYALLEVGSGSAVSAAVGSEDIVRGAALAAFAVGWAGLSVHFQTMYFTGKHRLSLKRYFYGKALSAILSTFFMLCTILLFPSLVRTVAPSGDFQSGIAIVSTGFAYIMNILFALFLSANIVRKISKKSSDFQNNRK